MSEFSSTSVTSGVGMGADTHVQCRAELSRLRADLEHTRQTQQVLLEVVDKARRLTSAIAIYGGDTSTEPFGRERLELNRALARLDAADVPATGEGE